MEGEGGGGLRERLGSNRRRVLGAAALAAILVAAVILVSVPGLGDGDASGPLPSSTGTGTVERRTQAERLTATGTVGFAGEATVLARLGGTITALPAIGDVIGRGERLYGLSGEPVLLLYGAVPAYRTLADRVPDGSDVEQLERNLAALGYDPGVVDEEFTYATTAAVIAWQEDDGLEASGEVELGTVAFLRGPQRVTKLEATLGEALVAGGAGEGSSRLAAWHPEAEAPAEAEEASGGSQDAPSQRERELERRERELEREREKLERERERDRERREREAAERAAGGGGGGGGGGGEEGGGGAAGGSQGDEAEAGGGEAAESESELPSIPVLVTSSARRVVSVELEANQQSIAHRGQAVEVVLPGGAEVPGEVIALAALEAPAAGEGEPEEAEPGIEATISVTGRSRIPALDGATVSVRFTCRIRRQVLSVPLTALVAIGAERFAVYAREGRVRRRIVVSPGLGADGYVEVEGKGLREGMTVETGE